ncbi:hypothetical protein [Mycolicibacterium aubagnense]|nr:hypothetical protein [Mycolicibacterium aubagnense]TLH66931.1 hypothetical protein C1S80_07550 [Mycolicibacterium aubagnense]WGI35253.1 hypothetical protein QDT91_13435 [Mycolicibacterium aubagnense]
MRTNHPATELSRQAPPVWLRAVMAADRTGSAWYVGTGFFFAPALTAVSPWPALTTALWVVIALAGLWLGLLGVAMATGLAMVLRSGRELSDDYWQSLLDYPDRHGVTARQLVSR